MEEKLETIILSLPSRMIRELDEMAKKAQTTRSQVLSAALEQYLKSNKVWEQIFRWGEECAKEFGIKNEEDVDRLIHE